MEQVPEQESAAVLKSAIQVAKMRSEADGREMVKMVFELNKQAAEIKGLKEKNRILAAAMAQIGKPAESCAGASSKDI